MAAPDSRTSPTEVFRVFEPSRLKDIRRYLKGGPLNADEQAKLEQETQRALKTLEPKLPFSCYGLPPADGPSCTLDTLCGLSILALAAGKAGRPKTKERLSSLKGFVRDGAVLAQIEDNAICTFSITATPAGCTTLQLCAPFHYDAVPLDEQGAFGRQRLRDFFGAVASGSAPVKSVRIPPAERHDDASAFSSVCQPLAELLRQHTVPWIRQHHSDMCESQDVEVTEVDTSESSRPTRAQQQRWVREVIAEYGSAVGEENSGTVNS